VSAARPDGPAGPGFCVHCGRPAAAAHADCVRAADLEPPRYCPQCARRMVVQVVPSGWSARCSVHGTVTSAPR
jgi:hypothetical protein